MSDSEINECKKWLGETACHFLLYSYHALFRTMDSANTIMQKEIRLISTTDSGHSAKPLSNYIYIYVFSRRIYIKRHTNEESYKISDPSKGGSKMGSVTIQRTYRHILYCTRQPEDLNLIFIKLLYL